MKEIQFYILGKKLDLSRFLNKNESPENNKIRSLI